MELKIEYLSVDNLTPYENNARKHETEDVEYIKNSIKEFGMNDPIGIWSDKNIIVEGHGRLLACKELGMQEVPCIRLDNLTDEQRKAYALAHNKTAEMSSWDFDLLDEELDSIFNIDMGDFGFELADDEETEIEEKIYFEYFKNSEIQYDIEKQWKTFTIDEFIDNIIDLPTAKYQFNRLCGGYKDGYNISLLFNPHRLLTDTKVSKNILQGFNNDEKYAKNFARYMVNVSSKVVVRNQYYKYIEIGTAGYQYVNEFPPYLARDIYKRFVNDGDKILNPCAGWGGRLIGLASCMFENIEYIETDPSTKTYEGLKKIKEWLCLGENYKQYNEPFEKLNLEENYFDFVFTSPPYFDTEHYAEEDTQSYINKNSYQEWKSDFLIPMMDNIVFAMKKGGKCLLNVGNKKYKISDDIKDYLNNKYKITTKNLDYSLDAGSEKSIRCSSEDFILFEK